jgi:hypothetical protein
MNASEHVEQPSSGRALHIGVRATRASVNEDIEPAQRSQR